MRLILLSLVSIASGALFSPQLAHSAAQAVLTCPAAIDNRSGTRLGTQFAGVQRIFSRGNNSGLTCDVSDGTPTFYEGRAGGTSEDALADLQISFDIHDSIVPSNLVGPYADRLNGRHIAVQNGALTRIDCEGNPVGNQFPIDSYGADKLLTFALLQGGQVNRFWTYLPAPANEQLQPLTIYQAPLLQITKNWFHSSTADTSSVIRISSSCSGYGANSTINRDGVIGGVGPAFRVPLYPGEEISISEDVPEGYVSQLMCDGELVQEATSGTLTYQLTVPTDLEAINEQACEFNSHKIVDFNLRKVWFGLTDLSADTISLTESIMFGDPTPVIDPVIVGNDRNLIVGYPIVLGAPITVNETHSENWNDSFMQCNSDATDEVFSVPVNEAFMVPNEVDSALSCTLVTSRFPAKLRVTAAQWIGPADDSTATITLNKSTSGNVGSFGNARSGEDGLVMLFNESVPIGDIVTIGVVAGENWDSEVTQCTFPGPIGNPPIVVENGVFRAISETGGKEIFCDVVLERKSALLDVNVTWNGINDGSAATLQIVETAGITSNAVTDVNAGTSALLLEDEPVYSGDRITLAQSTNNNWRNDGFSCSYGAPIETPIAVDVAGTFTVPADAAGQPIRCTVTNTLAPFRTVAENQVNAIDVGEIFNVSDTGATNTYSLSMQDNAITDNRFFTIDAATGVITFLNSPDFEMPGDADKDNTYELQVTVTDLNGISRVIYISISVSNDTQNECSPAISDRLLAQQPDTPKWYLLSVPCNVPPNTTFGQLLDPLPASDKWAAYAYDAAAATPDYVQVTADSLVPSPGAGFWFISTETLTMRMPQGSTTPTSSSSEPCTQAAPCNGHEINQNTLWSLMGNPTAGNSRYSDWKISNDSTSCTIASACTPSEAMSNNIDWVGYVYNHHIGNYKRLATDGANQQVVMPWDGYWLRFRNNSGETVNPWQVHIPRTTNRFIFVTDESFTGAQVGGLVAADVMCQSAATSAGLPGEYKAWLSDDTSSPSVNFISMPETPYLRVDGALVANGYSELANPAGLMHETVSLSQTFADASDSTVWTNTRADGSASNAHCSQWSSTSGTGKFGLTSRTGIAWTDSQDATENCTASHRLYCVGQ